MLFLYLCPTPLSFCVFSPPAQYFASTMIIVGLSVVVTVIVLQYHHHDPEGGKMPKWVRAKHRLFSLGQPSDQNFVLPEEQVTGYCSQNTVSTRERRKTVLVQIP